jgi:hypothetical protein
LRKSLDVIGIGERREDEHERTTADASKSRKMASKPGATSIPGTTARQCCVLSRGAACVLPRWCPV